MGSVFISYARKDRAVAEALGRSLSSSRITVWWDAELVASQDFTDAIERALRDATAVIVIWSPNSIKSKFVRDEARLALHLEKLVATKVASLAHVDIPLGFGGQHTTEVEDLQGIMRALHALGIIVPEAASHIQRQAISRSSSQSEGPLERQQSRTRSTSIRSDLAPEPVRMSNMTAIFRGLTFRIPTFQFTSNGVYTSIGAVIAYLALCISFFIGADVLFKMLNFKDYGDPRWFAPMTLALLAFALLAARQMAAWFNQRNFVAGWIFALPTALFSFLAAGTGQIALTQQSPSDRVTFSTMVIILVLVLGWSWVLYRRNR